MGKQVQKHITIKSLFIFSLIFLLLQSCSSDSSVSNNPTVGNPKTGSPIIKTIPIVTTNTFSDITLTSASGGGNITSDGGDPVTSRGIVWSTSSAPTISLATKTADGTGTGNFTSAIANLSPSTKYFARAYATNSVGIAYGNEIAFTTGAIVLPTITTTAITSITTNSAISGGTITSDGGATISAKGVVWSTIQNPTISLTTKTTDVTAIASFSSSIANLTPSTSYYIRAYATNVSGTSYGNEILFKTNNPIPAKVITKDPVYTNTNNNIRTGGYVLNDGGSIITSRGIVWGTSINPNIALNQKIISGNGQGDFVIDLNNLNLNTTYHIRAFATNNNGTFYGDDVSINIISNPRLTVGQNYGGGKIGYIDSSGLHGFIVASSDQVTTPVRWSGYGTSVFDLKNPAEIGYGLSNTTRITNFYVGSSLKEYAAKICEDLVLNGYDDWFLPSINELEHMHLKKNLIGGFSTSNWYWSSSNIFSGANYNQEPGNPRAWNFNSGVSNGFTPNSLMNVRAIRKF